MQNNTSYGVVLGLDVGDARIGVARAHTLARLPEPLEVIDRTKIDPLLRLQSLVKEHDVKALIVGLPLLKSGQEGPQATAVRAFAAQLAVACTLPQYFVDESFTSVEADTHKRSKQWQGEAYNDALAACLILERYFTEVLA